VAELSLMPRVVPQVELVRHGAWAAPHHVTSRAPSSANLPASTALGDAPEPEGSRVRAGDLHASTILHAPHTAHRARADTRRGAGARPAPRAPRLHAISSPLRHALAARENAYGATPQLRRSGSGTAGSLAPRHPSRTRLTPARCRAPPLAAGPARTSPATRGVYFLEHVPLPNWRGDVQLTKGVRALEAKKAKRRYGGSPHEERGHRARCVAPCPCHRLPLVPCAARHGRACVAPCALSPQRSRPPHTARLADALLTRAPRPPPQLWA
jgi:hypothetical protein